MSLIRRVQYLGDLDSGNSSTASLLANEVFTGDSVNILDFGIIYINVATNVGSATDGLMIQQSSDGINWDHDDVYTVPASGTKNYAINPHSMCFRVLYTNGDTDQEFFRLQTILKPNGKPSSHRIQDSIVDEDDAELGKSVLTGLSDITSIFENVKTYRQALQVDAALVHQVGISEHAKRELGTSTTLDVAASAGDILVNVTATAGFTVGGLVTINGTSVERGHFHITAVVADTSITLNRPLDNNHLVGGTVDLVDISMAVVGTLADPISFKIQSPSFERWQITRLLITMLDQTAMDDATFGGINSLTNATVLRVFKDGVFRTLTHWQTNGDLKDDMFNVEYSLKAPAGFFGLNGRWTLTASEYAVDLDGATGDYLEVLLQDDTSDLDDFEIKGQGRLFGS